MSQLIEGVINLSSTGADFFPTLCMRIANRKRARAVLAMSMDQPCAKSLTNWPRICRTKHSLCLKVCFRNRNLGIIKTLMTCRTKLKRRLKLRMQLMACHNLCTKQRVVALNTDLVLDENRLKLHQWVVHRPTLLQRWIRRSSKKLKKRHHRLMCLLRWLSLVTLRTYRRPQLHRHIDHQKKLIKTTSLAAC